MANNQRNGAKEAFWRELFSRHAKSGLSARAFCRREKVAESAFYFWRRTIAERDNATGNAAADATPTFLPMAVTDHRSPASTISIELRGGRRLQLPDSIEPDRLAALVRAIEAEPQR